MCKGAIFYNPIKPHTMQNPFAGLFTTHIETAQLSKFADKFTPKPYHQTHSKLYYTAKVAGYVCQLFTAAAAAIWIHTTAATLTGMAVALILTGIAVAAIEAAKRTTGEAAAIQFIMYGTMSPLVVVSIALIALSTTAAYYGADRAIIVGSGEAVKVNRDSTTAIHQATIDDANATIQQAKKAKWNGSITAQGLRIIEQAERRKAAAQERITVAEQRADTIDDATAATHAQTTNKIGTTASAITIVCELCLLLCLFYANYYQHRSAIEAGITTTPPTVPTTITPTPTQLPTVARIKAGRVVVAGFNNNATAGKYESTNSTSTNGRTCENCNVPITVGSARRRFCSDPCRIAAWEKRTGRSFTK